MHIAFLNPQGNFDPRDRYWTAHPDFGGQLVYVKELALALGRMGHRVDILTRRIVDPSWIGFEGRLDGYPGEPNVRIIRLDCEGERFLPKQELWPYLGTEWLPNIEAFYGEEGGRPDVTGGHYGDGGIAAALWHARGGPPFTFTAHSLGAHKLQHLLFDIKQSLVDLDATYHFARRIHAERVAMNHAARIVTSTLQERWDQYGHPAYAGVAEPSQDGKFLVAPPGVNLHVFDADLRGPEDDRVAAHLESLLRRDLLPERIGLPGIICASRLEPKKNHAGLVQAFAQSPDLQASANLLIVMRGVEDIHARGEVTQIERSVLDEIVAICEAQGLWGKVSTVSLESQAELAAAYRHLAARRSVFALTALYEPFGLAPLEAMAAGLPAVVTRRGGPMESLFDDESGTEYGVLVDPEDPGDICRGLLRLVGADNEWQRFCKRGRRRVLDRYTWETTARQYLAAYEAILAGAIMEPPGGHLPIPSYFDQPTPENDFEVKELEGYYRKA